MMADISNAYFQGEKLDRLLLLKASMTGIPALDYLDGLATIRNGTQYVGNKFWL